VVAGESANDDWPDSFQSTSAFLRNVSEIMVLPAVKTSAAVLFDIVRGPRTIATVIEAVVYGQTVHNKWIGNVCPTPWCEKYPEYPAESGSTLMRVHLPNCMSTYLGSEYLRAYEEATDLGFCEFEGCDVSSFDNGIRKVDHIIECHVMNMSTSCDVKLPSGEKCGFV
jgi:hypothetical protein